MRFFFFFFKPLLVSKCLTNESLLFGDDGDGRRGFELIASRLAGRWEKGGAWLGALAGAVTQRPRSGPQLCPPRWLSRLGVGISVLIRRLKEEEEMGET